MKLGLTQSNVQNIATNIVLVQGCVWWCGVNGIFHVGTKGKDTGKREKITLTNDRGCLTESKLAEQFADLNAFDCAEQRRGLVTQDLWGSLSMFVLTPRIPSKFRVSALRATTLGSSSWVYVLVKCSDKFQQFAATWCKHAHVLVRAQRRGHLEGGENTSPRPAQPQTLYTQQGRMWNM